MFPGQDADEEGSVDDHEKDAEEDPDDDVDAMPDGRESAVHHEDDQADDRGDDEGDVENRDQVDDVVAVDLEGVVPAEVQDRERHVGDVHRQVKLLGSHRKKTQEEVVH